MSPHVNGCRLDQLRYFPPLNVVQVRPNGRTDSRKRCPGGPNSVFSPGSCLILTAKPWGDTSPCSKSNLTWTRKNSGNRARDLDEPLKSDLFVILHCKAWIGGHKSVISRPPTRPLFICYSKFSIKLLAAILTFSICFFHSFNSN